MTPRVYEAWHKRDGRWRRAAAAMKRQKPTATPVRFALRRVTNKFAKRRLREGAVVLY